MLNVTDYVHVRPGVEARVASFDDVPASATSGRLVLLECTSNTTNLRCYDPGNGLHRWESELRPVEGVR